MKRLMLVCLLAVSSHGWAVDLDPECYALYDMFIKLDSRATIARSNISGEMHDAQCWPSLQGRYGDQHTKQPVISTCDDLVPHVIQITNNQSANGVRILQIYNAEPMTYKTIDKVANNMGLDVITDHKGRSGRVQRNLKHDGKFYVKNKGYYLSPADWAKWWDDQDAIKHGNDGIVLVPNSEPFVASPPTGAHRILDCSAEARYTDGIWLIQMHLDRDLDGQEFVGIAGLMELR